MTVGGISTALQAYQAAIRRGEAIRPPASTPIDQGVAAPRFDSVLRAELEGAARDLARSEGRSVDALTGRGNLQQVVEAVSAAELGLQKVTAVRDRVIAAYQEIMRMPI